MILGLSTDPKPEYPTEDKQVPTLPETVSKTKFTSISPLKLCNPTYTQVDQFSHSVQWLNLTHIYFFFFLHMHPNKNSQTVLFQSSFRFTPCSPFPYHHRDLGLLHICSTNLTANLPRDKWQSQEMNPKSTDSRDQALHYYQAALSS